MALFPIKSLEDLTTEGLQSLQSLIAVELAARDDNDEDDSDEYVPTRYYNDKGVVINEL